MDTVMLTLHHVPARAEAKVRKALKKYFEGAENDGLYAYQFTNEHAGRSAYSDLKTKLMKHGVAFELDVRSDDGDLNTVHTRKLGLLELPSGEYGQSCVEVSELVKLLAIDDVAELHTQVKQLAGRLHQEEFDRRKAKRIAKQAAAA